MAYLKFQRVIAEMVTATHDLKILRRIVGTVFINVMGMFTRLKQAAQFLFKHEDRTFHVTVTIRAWMPWCIHPHISRLADFRAAFPIRTGWPSQGTDRLPFQAKRFCVRSIPIMPTARTTFRTKYSTAVRSKGFATHRACVYCRRMYNAWSHGEMRPWRIDVVRRAAGWTLAATPFDFI
jgi:hypothetical protein